MRSNEMDDAKYFVKKVKTCSECKGEKCVQHPAWDEYWKEHPNGSQVTTLEQDREWFEAHGWYSTSSFDMRTDGTPDEEIMCGECEGEGEIVSEVDLFEIFPELMKAYELGTLSTTA